MRAMNYLLTLTLQSWKGVLAYTFVITLASFLAAMGLMAILFQDEVVLKDYVRAAIIVLAIAPPFGLFGGWHLLRITTLSDELERLVNRDRLTNVATRDYFFKRMRNAPDAFGASLMIDIDHFKSVNDTHGHLAGDAVIARVARIISDHVREEDIVCRFGGEEFIVFLSGHSAESGYDIAERMRQAIAQDALEIDGVALRVTVSIGGSLKDRLTNIEAAIQQADVALYQAKAAGRNRTIFADDQDTADVGRTQFRQAGAD